MTGLDRLLVRLLLRLYPASFRRARGHELSDFYLQCLSMSRHGAVVARLQAVGDAIRAAVELRRPAGRRSRRPRWSSDVRQALRSFRRAPSFYLGIIAVLSLGIGANGAVFSLMRAVLLAPLPYEAPDRLVAIWDARAANPRDAPPSGMLRGLRDSSGGALTDIAAVRLWRSFSDARVDLQLDDRAERLRAALATPNFFAVVGARMVAGRPFGEEDLAAGGAGPVVLSNALWRRAFGGDPEILGRDVRLAPGGGDPRLYTVVGILEPAFRFTYPDDIELWAMYPWSAIDGAPDGARLVDVAIGRMAPGVSFDTAQRRVSEAVSSAPRLELVSDWVTGDARPAVTLITAIASLLLIAACASVAGALLVTVSQREREMAMRTALGASRSRLAWQLLMEGGLVSAAATVCGAGLAVLMLPGIRAVVPALVPRADEMAVDAWFVAHAGMTTAVVTILASLVPALVGTRVDVVHTLTRASGSTTARRSVRWRLALVAVQASLATVLLVCATLLLVSVHRLGSVDLGFDGRDVFAAELHLLGPRYSPLAARTQFQQALLSRLAASPGVLEVATTSAVPFRGSDSVLQIPRPPDDRLRVSGHVRMVSPEYFSIMRIPLLRGELFGSAGDAGQVRGDVLSESLARELFGSDDPIGRTFQAFGGEHRVAGIVSDVRSVGYDVAPAEALYMPASRSQGRLLCVIGRAAEGVDVQMVIRRIVREIDPGQPVMAFTTVDQIVNDSVADRRFYAGTASFFGIVALLITVTGIGVVVSRAVVERRRELAVRIALGAGPVQAVRIVTRQATVPLVIGVTVGLALAWSAASVFASLLFEVSTREPSVYGAAAALVIVVGLMATLLSAGRLRRVELASVLKTD